MRHLLKFILDMYLELDNSVGVGRVFNLLSYLTGFGVVTGFEKTLRMVELVLRNIGEELG